MEGKEVIMGSTQVINDMSKVQKMESGSDEAWDILNSCITGDEDEDSRIVDAINQPINEKTRRAFGMIFFSQFDQKKKHDVVRLSKFMKQLKASKETRLHWVVLLRDTRLEAWAGKSLFTLDSPKRVPLSDEALDNILDRWDYVFIICEDVFSKGNILMKLWMVTMEKIINGKVGTQSPKWKVRTLRTWRNFTWAMRSKLTTQKYINLVIQPGYLSVTSPETYIERIFVFWAAGRAIASNKEMPINEKMYSESFGAALKLCMENEEEDKPPQLYHVAVDIICLLSGGSSSESHPDLPALTRPFCKDSFTKIAPGLTKDIIRLILISDTKAKNILTSNILTKTMEVFLTALAKCDEDCIPSLSRLTEFIAEQATSNQASWVVKLIITIIPVCFLRHRFVSDDTKEGITSTSRRMLKVMLTKNHSQSFDEAKELTRILLSSNDHLAALDQITYALTDEIERPKSSSSHIIKLWNLSADIFSRRIAQGMEVSNSQTKSDLTSIESFICIPFFVQRLTSVSDTTLKKFRQTWKEFYTLVKSNATLLHDFNNDTLLQIVGQAVYDRGLMNSGPEIALELLLTINVAPETPTLSFSESKLNESSNGKWGKNEELLVKILERASEAVDFEDIKSIAVESAMGMMLKMVQDFGADSVRAASHLFAEYTKPALLNRKNPAWQFTIETTTRLLECLGSGDIEPIETYPLLEKFFILMLSRESSKRLSYAVGQCWERKFKAVDEKLTISDELWSLLKVHYAEGNWQIPTRFRAPNGPSTPKRTGSPKGGRSKNNTPQRFSRQLAALQGGTQSSPRTPTRRGVPKGNVLASTYVKNSNETAEFTVVHSPINFSNRRLTANQKEKMKDKKTEEHVGTSLYSHVDDSQSRGMSQFLASDTQTINGDSRSLHSERSQDVTLRKNSMVMELDESAMDGSTFNMPNAQSTIINQSKDRTCDVTTGVGIQCMDDSSINETKTSDMEKTADMTCDVTSGVGIQCMDESSINESSANQSTADASLNQTANITSGIGLQGTFQNSTTEFDDESMTPNKSSVIEAVDVVKNTPADVTTGLGMQTSIADSTVNESAYDIANVTNENEPYTSTACERSLLRTSSQETIEDDDGHIGRTLNDSVISGIEELPDDDEDEEKNESVMIIEAESASNQQAASMENDEDTTEDTNDSRELTPDPLVDLTDEVENRGIITIEDSFVDCSRKKLFADDEGQSTQTSTQPFDDDRDELESAEITSSQEAADEPSEQDFEKEEGLKPCPILKRKRSANDSLNESKVRRVSFLEEFEPVQRSIKPLGWSPRPPRPSTNSPRTRNRFSRSDRMLQLANPERGQEKQEENVEARAATQAWLKTICDEISQNYENLSADDKLMIVRAVTK